MSQKFDMIKEFKIIEKLKGINEELYSHLQVIVNSYADTLDSGPLIREMGLTPHDFSHHCVDIYKIIGELLPESFYGYYHKGYNLFILCVGVLFHDISLTQRSDEDIRRNHSRLSQKYVLDLLSSDSENTLKEHFINDFDDCLGDIIYAHSDIKSPLGEVDVFTFNEIVDKYEGSELIICEDEKINVPFLAAVLRLADELDISDDRIKGIRFEEKYNIDESKEHFTICKYFKNIQVSSNKTYLTVMVNENKLSHLHDDEKTIVILRILKRYNKIKKEFDNLNSRVFRINKYSNQDIWTITNISLKNEEKYNDIIKKKEF